MSLDPNDYKAPVDYSTGLTHYEVDGQKQRVLRIDEGEYKGLAVALSDIEMLDGGMIHFDITVIDAPTIAKDDDDYVEKMNAYEANLPLEAQNIIGQILVSIMVEEIKLAEAQIKAGATIN